MSIPVAGMIITLAALAVVLWNGHRTRAMLREAQTLRDRAQVIRDQRRRDL
ncbi:hypothetical protein [Streptomyces sp. NPDC006477]|uniref:hypothetical protein n=1 Tax=Streptomyces sp. NPDC006477 TaxID=3364747 RepID=UPI0036AFE42A